MSNRVHIICQPEAGGGLGQKRLREVQDVLCDFQMEYLTYLTDFRVDAQALVQQLITRGHTPYDDHLLVVGGDGTLSQVVAAMQQMGAEVPLTFVPAGSGNDFARSWVVGQSVDDIIRRMLFQRQPRQVPVFTYREHHSGQSGVIMNNFGMGFDAQANHSALVKRQAGLGIFKLWPRLSYYYGIIDNLNKIPHFEVQLTIDDRHWLIDDCSLFAVMNSPYLGGGIHLDLQTLAVKPELAAVALHHVDRSQLAHLIKSILFTKKVPNPTSFTRYTGTSLRVQTDQPVHCQVDGEDLYLLQVDLEVAISSYPFYL